MANKQVRTPLSTIVPIAGQRVRARMINGTRGWAVMLHATATVDITGAGATLLNRGSVFALFDEIGIEENGRDRHLYDGKLLRFLSEMHAPSVLSATRLTGVGIATTVIQESAVIWFAHPLQAQPHETAFREADARQTLEVFVKMAANPLFRLADPTAVGTVTGVSVTATHIHDPRSVAPPVFIPTARQITTAIGGANTKQEIFVKTPHFIRAFVLQQEDDNGERADIINKVALRGDFRDLIGPQQLDLDEITRFQEFEFGGNVFANQAQIGLNFQTSGRLSNVINPVDDVNLRFELDVAASGTNPIVRLAVLELERVSGLVTEQLPFPV